MDDQAPAVEKGYPEETEFNVLAGYDQDGEESRRQQGGTERQE